ncbi:MULTISPECIES: DUF1403 family protein [Thioclava]|mgnify:CR=1 FL=1|uniref:DUF1403 family protein n=1 Tax=Thioclava TaxID=285107 RepID=UPI000C698951|nr:DUF1403 family protein [Thioclava electrotropha]MAQ38130.1 hypothetical protein [Thioclava sp.]
MTSLMPDIADAYETLPHLPAWVTLGHGETPEDVAFLSGAALSHLHLVLTRDAAPHALLRERLALRAAELRVTHSGRPERAPDLRDAVNLLRDGDLPGPAGEVYLAWRRAVERPISVASLQRALPYHAPEALERWLAVGQGAPVARAADVLEAVLAEAPRAQLAALILADAALAQALGWNHLVPLLSTGLKRAELRLIGTELHLACHRALHTAAIEADRLLTDLTRRTARLRAVAPKLRAKGAAEAVALFLSRDAVAPAALPLPDRAARRLCDRLVQLGAIRELTGRDTFRLYGV